MDLYAQWKQAGIYTIIFRSNGGTGTMSDQTVNQGNSMQISANTFTYTDKMFIGWNTKADGTGDTYLDQENIKPNKDLILYAQWINNQAHTITLNSNDGLFDDGRSIRNLYSLKTSSITTK